MEKIEGNIVDILNREIYPADILIKENKIFAIQRNDKKYNHYICPGFIDAHVHIESSMLTPENFSELIIRKGTVAIINDPHEIANVAGSEGINFMIENSSKAAVKTFFTIPSCVPATPFDSSGCIISPAEVEHLAHSGNFIGLSEMMNVPGVIGEDASVLSKIDIANRYNLKIDGHAPGLAGDELKKYISYNITTDHEASTLEEAEEKIKYGMKILIRQGSAAKNYEALKSLIKTHSDNVMFCTDDSHPDEIIYEGHIDKIVKKAVKDGFDLFDVLRIAAINPIKHYQIGVGCLQPGDPADFIIIEDLTTFNIQATYIDGIKKYDSLESNHKEPFSDIVFDNDSLLVNNFNHSQISVNDLNNRAEGEVMLIQAMNGELFTQKYVYKLTDPVVNFESDINNDILKIVYLNRYNNDSVPKIAYIRGFGLQHGAFASSVSHDSHNIIAVGCCDKDIADCMNTIISAKGGLAVKNNEEISLLSLPIAGIMTYDNGDNVAKRYRYLNMILNQMGCKLDAPFMTLSFMALIVIPELKIGEGGLFDFNSFKWFSS